MVILGVTAGLLIALTGVASAITWQGSPRLHTVMEAIACSAAVFVGIISLVRHQTRDDNIFLFLGAGFFGAGILDGYHAIVTAEGMSQHLPSTLSALDSWTWFASRCLLSVCLYLSWLTWKRGNSRRIVSDLVVYLCVGTLILSAFLVFIFTPVPGINAPKFILHQPTAPIPAIFFGLALVGYASTGSWKHDLFQRCLVASLMFGLVSQVCLMFRSETLFSGMFDVVHLLKIVSYMLVAAGLIVSVFRAFEEAQRLTAERQLQIAEVDHANEALEAFVRWASHDLRSPLRHIFSFCGFVRESATDRLTETEKSDLERVMEAATSMSDLLDGLSRFAKLGAASLQLETFSLNDVVESVVEQLPLDQQTQVHYSGLDQVVADKALLTVVIQNLIENGLKYVKDRGPEVTVKSESASEFDAEFSFGAIHVSVADNGIGVERKHLERIFEPGIRGVAMSEYSGTGFGLATSARIIAAHQGKIWVESEAGKGSVFHFTIPNQIVECHDPVAESGPWAKPRDKKRP